MQLEKTIGYKKRNGNSEQKQFVHVFVTDTFFKSFDLHKFNKPKVTFGRDSTNDIVVHSPVVSSFHGYFLYYENKWFIKDNNSTNGLLVNNAFVSSLVIEKEEFILIDKKGEAHDQGVALLVNHSNNNEQWQVKHVYDQLSIGRDKSNDIVIDHVGVSLKHAIIKKEGLNYVLEDLKSTNHVVYNKSILDKKSVLNQRDYFQILTTTFLFSNNKLLYKTHKEGVSVTAKNITKTVTTKNGPLIISDNISLTIDKGDFVSIIGGSGAGKSTFMNCLSGFNPSTSGQVFIDEYDLYENYAMLKSMMGYVPQQDIVYNNLTVYDMLFYTAQMRLPSDLSKEEIEQRINKVIEITELTQRKETYIRQLSGGQKKRASIAVELLSDPSLLFLDEPTSGLDPGTEKNLMKSLSSMTKLGKTIVLVTHTTANLHLCDKIVMLGKGGKLCFYGSYEEAKAFFEVDDLIDVYNMVNENTEYWHDKYSRTHSFSSSPESSSILLKKTKINQFRQWHILSKRYAKLIYNDKKFLLMLLIQAPLLALFIKIAVNDDIYQYYEHTKAILFTMACCAIWMGLLNSIQEICKERNIFYREYAANLKIVPYFSSKLGIQAIISFVQSLLFISSIALLIGLPEQGVIINSSFSELFLTTFLLGFASSTMGLLVSSLSPTTEIAMIAAPLLLVPQMLFSGMLFELTGFMDGISTFIVSRWGMQAYGSVANLNDLLLEIQKEFPQIEKTIESVYEHSAQHLIQLWSILFGIGVLFFVFSMFSQKLQLRNR